MRDIYVQGAAPFSGYWGNASDRSTHPASHHLAECEPHDPGRYTYPANNPGYDRCNPGQDPNGPGGDWSIDYYGPPGIQVRFGAVGVGTPQANITAKVWAVAPTCTPPADAGWTVFVNVYSTNGTFEGWYSFGHLDNVIQGDLPKTISTGTVLGTLRRWTYQARCWEVQYDTGVHTHIEMYNENYTPMNDGYGCYRDYTLGNWMGYLTEFGHIGRTRYPGIRAVCTPPVMRPEGSMREPSSSTGPPSPPRGTGQLALLALSGLALAGLLLAVACWGSDARQGGPSPAASMPPTPGPGEAGGPIRPTPPALLLTELRSLPPYPGAESRSTGFSTTGLDARAYYFLAACGAPAPEEVLKFYADKLAALGWLDEAGPKFEVVTWPKMDAREPDQILVRTWVKKDLRFRLAAGSGRDKVGGEGLIITLTIEPKALPAFPTRQSPFEPGNPDATVEPLPTPVEPPEEAVPASGAAPLITPTLTPTPIGGEPPPADIGPTLTPTPTPAGSIAPGC